MRLGVWMAAGGMLGTLARWGLSTLVQRAGAARFPWGTVSVNLAGCFAFGLIWAYADSRGSLPAVARIALLTGFLGAFTTFSAFAFETVSLLQDGRWGWALANLVLQNAAGLALMGLGLLAGRAAA